MFEAFFPSKGSIHDHQLEMWKVTNVHHGIDFSYLGVVARKYGPYNVYLLFTAKSWNIDIVWKHNEKTTLIVW